MSKLSDNIQITYKNVITIYQETANLLQDTSSILEKSGYRCLHGNSIGTNNPRILIALNGGLHPMLQGTLPLKKILTKLR